MKLKQYREQIDQIDNQMKRLFIERMEIIKRIGEYKKENRLAVFDEIREKEMIEKHRASFTDLTLWHHYERFLKNIVMISKEVQL